MSRVASNFEGLHVAAFESRRAEEMARLIERCGGQPHVSPSMREVSIAEPRSLLDFAQRLLTGQIDILIFLTGVGVRRLLEIVEKHVDRQRFLNCVSDSVTIVRGPKPQAVLHELGIKPTFSVPEPNTWRDLLDTVDRELSVVNQTIAIQEYGKPNSSLVAGLEARGATVVSLKVYDWDFPVDVGPLQENVQAIADGKRDVCLFTSAHQLTNLLRMASRMELSERVRQALRETVICSIGPTTSEAIRDVELVVDFEPTHPKMGHLVAESSRVAQELQSRKQLLFARISAPIPDVQNRQAPWYDSSFMRACRGEPVDRLPVWLMRQAGRYLAEYRDIRRQVSFAELCRRPDLCTEIMVSTVNRLGVDAAIIFSDLLPMLEPMGLELEYLPGDGPVIHNPVRESADVDRVVALDDPSALEFVFETVRQTRAALPASCPLIGFAGAPFTLASYAIEGGSSRHYLHTKTLMRRDEGAWRALMDRLVRTIVLYLRAQIAAGVQCVQLFDSWVGCLGPADYRQYVLPFMREIMVHLPGGVPVISFATGNPALLPCLAEAKPAVVGVDWRISMSEADQRVGRRFALQGNLDPAALFGPREAVVAETEQILESMRGRKGYIFNLGHGVLPQTPVDNVLALIDAVHRFDPRT